MDSETHLDATGRSSSNQHTVLTGLQIPGLQVPRRSRSMDSARFRIGSWIFSWSRLPTVRTVTYGTPAPRRNLVLVSLVPALVLLGVFGVFLLRDGVGQFSGVSQTGPMPEVSLGSPIANVVQSPQPKSNPTFVVPQLPIAKSENFPGTQTRALADNTRSSRPSERKATSERKIPKGKLLAPHSQQIAWRLWVETHRPI